MKSTKVGLFSHARCSSWQAFFLAISCLSSYVFAIPSGDTSKTKKGDSPKEKLVRIAILDFVDQRASADYEYLSNSLAKAIESVIKKKFTYEKTKSATNKKFLRGLLLN